MQIVIDIPEREYKVICENNYVAVCACPNLLSNAIKSGIVLPEPHGELVDIRPLMRGLYSEMCVEELTYTTSEVYKMIDEETNIILEATKENI